MFRVVSNVCVGCRGVEEAMKRNGKSLGREEMVLHELGYLIWEVVIHRENMFLYSLGSLQHPSNNFL